jgi:hypothetical protein
MLVMLFLYLRILVLNRFRIEARFTANDPWNGNRPTPFLLEAYLLAPKGTAPPARHNDSCRYGIRPERDEQTLNVSEKGRMLPESLVRLWLAGRIPVEALPRLLFDMEPKVTWADGHLVFLTRAYAIAQWMSTVLFVLWFLGHVTLKIQFGDHGAPPVWSGTVVTAVVVGGILFLLYFRPRARRKKQMAWALAHL